MSSRKLILSFMAVFVLSSFSFVVSVEADSSMWSQTYGGTDNDVAHSLVATSDGGYAIAGITDSVGDLWGEYGVLLVKTDSSGNMEWNRTYGKFYSGLMDHSPIQACSCSLVATSDGGYAIAGQQGVDAWLVKTDAFGYMEWNQTYSGEASEHAFSLVQTSDGGYALAGDTGSFGAGADYWLIKTDADGNMQWNQTYGGTKWDTAHSLVATSDGGYAIVGKTFSSDSVGTDAWLVKTDASGNMEWNQTYGGYYSEYVYSLVATSDGGYAIAGLTHSYGAGSTDFWLVKTDAFGYMEWNQTYGGVRGEYAFSLVQTSDGGYAIAGLTESFGAGPYNYWLVKTDAFGYMEWNQTYSGEGLALDFSLVKTSDGGYAIAGSTESFGAGGKDFWLVKTDEYGVVPEYSSWLLTSILLVATSVIIIYKKKFTDDTGDYWEMCTDFNASGGSALTNATFRIVVMGHTDLTVYQGDGTGWVEVTPEEGDLVFAASISESPTSSTPHWIIEFSLLKTSGVILVDAVWAFRLAVYDESNSEAGVRAWPPDSDPDVPDEWGVQNYSSDPIPEGLSFGILVLLSSAAVVVASVVSRKRSRIDKSS